MRFSTGIILASTPGAMDYVLSVVTLMAGLGAFLFGFKVLSDNIEKLATNRLRGWFDKTGKSRLVGVGIGTAVTAIIQSSAATTVMVVGFVNAGIMSLFQATTVIMGANIGTTVTAYIASMADIPLIEFVTALTCIGAFMNMIAKQDKTKTIGMMLVGLGLIFLGLQNMSLAMKVYKESVVLQQFLSKIGNPFLLLLFGIVITAIVQSSSVVTSLVILMVSQGMSIGTGGNEVLFLILGSNIGTCVTALISSIGASTNAKRASLIHLLFNVFGTTIFTIFLLCWPNFMQTTLVRWFPGAPGLQIALFHTFFNVGCTCMFLPFVNVFVKIAQRVIRDKKAAAPTSDMAMLDERFIKTPSIAVRQANKAATVMAQVSMNALRTAFNGFVEGDESKKEEVTQTIEHVSQMEKGLIAFLVKLSATGLSLADEQYVSSVHNATGDIIRISELADNITKYTHNCQRDNIQFSPGVIKSLQEMYSKIENLYEKTLDVFDKKDITAIKDVDAVEDSVDASRKEMIKEHIRRLNEGKCQPSSSSIYISLVGNLERAADHLTYIAHAFD